MWMQSMFMIEISMWCKWLTQQTNTCTPYLILSCFTLWEADHVWLQAAHQKHFCVPLSLGLALFQVFLLFHHLLAVTFSWHIIFPQCVCVQPALLCLSFFISDTFSVPTAGRGNSSHMPKLTALDLQSSHLPSHLPSVAVFFTQLILSTTSDHTPFSFVFLSLWLKLFSFIFHTSLELEEFYNNSVQ